MTVSPNLTLPVLVLIRIPSLLSFSAGEIYLFYLNLIQFDETLYYTVLTVLQCCLKPVSSNKQLY